MMKIPEQAHWAIVTEQSIMIPGDERSRTNPGHGYPEHTETYIAYTAFFDEDQFKAELRRRMQSDYDRPRTRGIYVEKVFVPDIQISAREKK